MVLPPVVRGAHEISVHACCSLLALTPFPPPSKMTIELADNVDVASVKEHKKKSKRHRRDEAEAGGRYVTCSSTSMES